MGVDSDVPVGDPLDTADEVGDQSAGADAEADSTLIDDLDGEVTHPVNEADLDADDNASEGLEGYAGHVIDTDTLTDATTDPAAPSDIGVGTTVTDADIDTAAITTSGRVEITTSISKITGGGATEKKGTVDAVATAAAELNPAVTQLADSESVDSIGVINVTQAVDVMSPVEVAAGGVGSTSPAPPTIPTATYASQTLTDSPPIKRFLDKVGQHLSTLPVSPLTDFLSGMLWLVRRTLLPAGSPPAWLPACIACSANGQSSPTGQLLMVTSRVDGQAGSLRDVLSTASSGDVVRFAPWLTHSTLHLTQGELDIDASVRIEGSRQTLDADGQSRIMRLDEAGTSITLVGMTFRNGAAPGDPSSGATAGGAILAEGITLQICGSRFVSNAAVATDPAAGSSSYMQDGRGGAIAAISSTVSVRNSAFVVNRAAGADNNTEQQASQGYGGAIFADDSTVNLYRTEFERNTAAGGSAVTPIQPFPTSYGGSGSGGAIFAVASGLSADNVTFRANSAVGGQGLDGSASNPYRNDPGGGGNAAGGALWVVGLGNSANDVVGLDLQDVMFKSNSAIGGSAGQQGMATLSANQGGTASGGGLGTASWVAVNLADVTFDGNKAQGGGAGPNAPDAGSNTGTGGRAQGGGAYLASTASIDATRLLVRNNTAQGGAGGDSAPDSGTEAGEGGWAYGGGLSVNNTVEGMPPPVIPLNIRDSQITGNRVVGGQAGRGPAPSNGLGAGGAVQGGGLVITSLFNSALVGVRFIDNSAIAGQGKFAMGGALINPFGTPPPGTVAGLLVQNSVFRGNSTIGGDDAASESYRASSGGGLFNNSPGTRVIGSWFASNVAIGGNDTGSGHVGSGHGGAIVSDAANPTIAIYDSTFVANKALGGRRLVAGESIDEPNSGEAGGGAIYTTGGTVTINGGSLAQNRAVVRTGGERLAFGGAIASSGYLGTTGVQFTSNVASSATGTATGGAISFNGDSFNDIGSSFRGNLARAGSIDGSGYGGAMYLQQDSQLNGSVITGNRARAAQGYGGAIALPDGPDTLTRTQTMIDRNRATTAGNDLWWPTSSHPASSSSRPVYTTP